MKTEEDEAFDELAKRQGDWGGGFQAKRAMAADKMQEPVSFPCCGYTDATAIKWNQFNGVVQCHMCGQIYTAAQPAHCQCTACKDGIIHASDCAVHNGPAYPAGECDCGVAQEIEQSEIFCGVDYADGVLAVSVMRRIPDGVAELLHSEQIELAQPAQEPVAWTLLLTGEHHGIIGEAGEKFIGAPECYQRVNVYTTPPKREWVGLTDEDYVEMGLSLSLIEWQHKAIEAKLKEKNT
jgi:hypothetical protein